ncbi:hypothetical protein EYF80_031544 [Liparis tanakae]|uniref:Uncharacterized protein n=1 Tax=Liparis tanakae TaxID=230148 RepID=A0A4Z2H023_9TELE|nr:hypothetical protein EYF80_031544 [Liparis tanakae]
MGKKEEKEEEEKRESSSFPPFLPSSSPPTCRSASAPDESGLRHRTVGLVTRRQHANGMKPPDGGRPDKKSPRIPDAVGSLLTGSLTSHGRGLEALGGRGGGGSSVLQRLQRLMLLE